MMKWIIAVIVVAIGGWFLFFYNNNNSPEASPTPTVAISPTASPTATSESVTVTYTDSGYSPASINISAGTTVTFVNNSSRQMWTASAVHPSHSVYSNSSLSEHCPDTANTTFDACQGIGNGQSWSFTFTKTGTWRYHNHLRSSDTGTVVVQ